MKPEISIEDLSKLDIRLGTITLAEKVEGSEKLLRLEVDFGSAGKRQILTGMQKHYAPEEMQGMQTIFLFNLQSRKMMGIDSQGMIMALTGDDGKPIFMIPKIPSTNGLELI